MNAPALFVLAGFLLLAGLYVAWRLIGTLDEPPARRATADPLVSERARTDRLIAAADAILLTDRALMGVGL